jgi:hypothetical protein
MMPTERRLQHAAKAWRLMFDFLMWSAAQRLQRRGLTPNGSRDLDELVRIFKKLPSSSR